MALHWTGCSTSSSGQHARKRQLSVAALLAVAVGLSAVSSWRKPSCAARHALLAVGPGTTPHIQNEALNNGVCEKLQREQVQSVESRVRGWEKAAIEGRTIFGYGNKASRLLNQTLQSFDDAVRTQLSNADGCPAERQVLSDYLQHQLHSVFLIQRSTIEQVLFQRLKKQLLRRMRFKKRELNVKEKLRLLHSAMADYDGQVGELLPFFVPNSERDRAERRLSELQWGIGDTAEAKEMMQRWKMERLRRMPMRQSKGMPSISLSPGMRLMFRPSGLGNFQLFSRRQVGPMHNPNEVSVAMHNDGHVIDVYNKKPRPPLIKFQPTLGVDVSMG